MRAYERLLDYVRVYTTSDPESGTHPSAAREFDLAHKLVEELKALGVEDARVDEHCYVYGSLPATPGCEEKPALGLIAHMDTAPDAGGENVNPILHENYDGGDVVLPATGKVMKVSAFPFLASMKGETLITTDGTTLLGADDKAGVAEIMTAVETVIREGRPHGKLCIGFTPDEEIGEEYSGLSPNSRMPAASYLNVSELPRATISSAIVAHEAARVSRSIIGASPRCVRAWRAASCSRRSSWPPSSVRRGTQARRPGSFPRPR